MNPETPNTPREELEARLTALLLGELSAEDAAAVRQAIAQDPELARLHERLKHTIDLVREAALAPEEQAGKPQEPLKLSADKREKLLEQLKGAKPKDPVLSLRSRRPWLVPTALAAVLVGLLGVVGMWLNSGLFMRKQSLAAAYRFERSRAEVASFTDSRTMAEKRVAGAEAPVFPKAPMSPALVPSAPVEGVTVAGKAGAPTASPSPPQSKPAGPGIYLPSQLQPETAGQVATFDGDKMDGLPGIHPTVPVNGALVQDARSLYEAGNYEGATEKLKQAIKNDPNDKAAFDYLDRVMTKQSAGEARLRESWSKAKELDVGNVWNIQAAQPGGGVASSGPAAALTPPVPPGQIIPPPDAVTKSDLPAVNLAKGDTLELAPLPVQIPAPTLKGAPAELPSGPNIEPLSETRSWSNDRSNDRAVDGRRNAAEAGKLVDGTAAQVGRGVPTAPPDGSLGTASPTALGLASGARTDAGPTQGGAGGTLKLKDANLGQVLDSYVDLSGRELLLRPNVLPEAKVTVDPKTDLSKRDAVQVLDSVLSLHGITMVPQGEKFVKAVPQAQANQEANKSGQSKAIVGAANYMVLGTNAFMANDMVRNRFAGRSEFIYQDDNRMKPLLLGTGAESRNSFATGGDQKQSAEGKKKPNAANGRGRGFSLLGPLFPGAREAAPGGKAAGTDLSGIQKTASELGDFWELEAIENKSNRKPQNELPLPPKQATKEPAAPGGGPVYTINAVGYVNVDAQKLKDSRSLVIAQPLTPPTGETAGKRVQIALPQSGEESFQRRLGNIAGGSTTAAPGNKPGEAPAIQVVRRVELTKPQEDDLSKKGVAAASDDPNQLYAKLASMDRSELRKALATASPDPQLADLFGRLHLADQEMANQVEGYGPTRPGVQQTRQNLDDINRQIDERVDGVMNGLKVEIEKRKAAGESARADLDRRLDSIRLNEVSFPGVPLSAAIESLSRKVRESDPQKKGINFIVSPNAAAPPTVNPQTGLPEAGAPTEAVDLGALQVRIDPPSKDTLKDISLRQALDVIAKAAERPIKFSVEPNGIVVSAKEQKPGEKVIADDSATPPKPAVPPPIPQPEIQSAENPFSTFSLNVSDVSFKLAASSLEKNVMPDPATIRSEEFLNAFDYRDPEPAPGVPVAFAWERARYPFAHNRDLLRFSIQTAARGREPGRPLNLVLLLDNSGSMERADRVRIIQEALRVLAAQLTPQDKLSIVTFSRTPRLWVDGVSGSQAAEALSRVAQLTPEGGTNLEDAMHAAYQTALRHYVANGVNRVVLLTDGAANLGNVDPDALKQKVETHRRQGIALDCFGIGWEGYNDDLLEMLSRNGDGRYGFVNSLEEAATEFAGQLAGALQVAAADVKVQVEFNPRRVTAYRQIGYAKHQLKKEQFRDNTVDAAEIAAAESGNALYVIEANPRGDGPLGTVRVRYRVPTTGQYLEHEWMVPFTGMSVSLEQASPALRLAASASAFSEWLVSSPYAGEVTPDRLLGYLRGVPEVFGADARPKKIEWMIRQAKAIAGR
jgi:Mg-chelatase subunit ChlD/anti-sigma factor RsiW